MHLLWQFLNLSVIITAAVLLLRKPMARYLRRRSLSLRDSLREAYRTEEEAMARLALVDAQIEYLNREISGIQERAKKDAQKLREKILKEAQREYERTLNNAQQNVEREYKESNKRIKAYAIDKSINYAEQQIAKELSKELHYKLIDDYIERLSLSYAGRIMKAAEGQRQLTEVRLHIERFLKLMFHHPLFHHPKIKGLLLDKSISPIDKERILESLFQDLDIDDLVKNFLLLLIKKGRIEQLNEIFLSLQEQRGEEAGRLIAEVTTAQELPTNQQEKLQSKLSQLTGHPVKLKLIVSPEIIGGAITKIGSVVYDGSVKHQLNKLKKNILESDK